MELKEPERLIPKKVGDVISSINGCKHVDQVISTLHSLAALLFPVDSLSFIGSIDTKYREEISEVKVPSETERSENWRTFYKGSVFRALARTLLYDVAVNWLACFPISARKHVFDVFFVNGRASEVVQALVPCLQHNGNNSSAVCTNAERLLVLCLLENDGVLNITQEFAILSLSENLTSEELKQVVSAVAQLITSIPDKARPAGPTSLSSHLFFKQITIQLLAGAEKWDQTCDGEAVKSDVNGPMMFAGEAFSRICRRGSVDVLLSEVITHILIQVKSLLSDSVDMDMNEKIESKAGLRFWSKIMESINDPYSVGRFSEQLLHHLAAQNVSDLEAYWIMQLLFHRIYKHQISLRSMFLEKFLLWNVFPVCCLNWIINFAIIECAPGSFIKEANETSRLIETVQRLAIAWSKLEFVQSASMEQQAYVTAALGLCLEKITKEDLDSSKDAMHSILRGVSCRLENPDYLIRKMASAIALVFSKVIDPQNPLYLDESYTNENIDWEFGIATKVKSLTKTEINNTDDTKMVRNVNNNKKKPLELKIIDPDEIVDPATLSNYLSSDEEDEDEDEDDNASVDSESSLAPYDLSDDGADLKKKFSQLVDVVGSLRKSDDADAVEGALEVSEKLIRASPDELKYIASDLVRTLLHVRCSDLTVEGEEDSSEDKRQKSLIAMIIKCPVESLNTLNNLLCSPNLDISQRIMILDIMTEAAQEFAYTKSTTRSMPQLVRPGPGLWKEISTPGSLLNWSESYERELPVKTGRVTRGVTRRWARKTSLLGQEKVVEGSGNMFPQYAAMFMLPAMEGFDKKRHGVDLLGRDFIVLGKVIYMLGVCMKCASMHPEASVLASPLLDMISSREICHHKEAYVRRSVLFAASCILVALHPSFVASALTEGNAALSNGLEWVRTWALQVVESDTDRDCYTLAMTCLQLHAELALQASRALESTESRLGSKGVILPSSITKENIRITLLK